MNRDRELTDDHWAALAPHLPAQRAATGRPAKDHRTVVEAILWRLRTGAPWRDLPERYGPWKSVYTRFRRWQQAGVWDRALAALQAEADARGDLDWSLHFLDGTVIRAHPHAAGAKKGAVTAPSAGAREASRPSSTCAPSGAASPSAGC
jgi:transposase